MLQLIFLRLPRKPLSQCGTCAILSGAPRAVARPSVHGPLRFNRSISRLSAPSKDSPLFRYTSGRWIYNEARRFKERERVFNIDELLQVAAEAVSRSREDVAGIEKIGEGACSRAFAIRFEDGFKVVARIPYPFLQPEGLVVASEAATMTFLRSKGVPVPKVFAYSCTPNNAAGTGHIVMEYCSGTSLASVKLVRMEACLSDVHIPASGSLYFLRDLPANATGIPVDAGDANRPESIYVGPSTGLHLWFGKRGGLNVDRGPFHEPEDVMSAGALKEMRYLEQHGRPLLPFNRFQREVFGFRKQQPEVHIDTLRKYLQISKYLIPRDRNLTKPVLRHPDLRPSNVFVSDDLEITALIDWQHSSALPLFLSAGVPDFLNSPRGQLPTSCSDAPTVHCSEASKILSRQRRLYDVYLSAVEQKDPPHYKALTSPFSIGRQKIHRLSGDPWQGDNIPLRSSLIFLKQNWKHFSSEPCPISFTEEEKQECLRLDDAEQESVEALEEFKQAIGLGPGGWVSNENYESGKEAIARMKEMSLDQAETEEERIAIWEHWVFDDFDEYAYD